MYIRKQPNSSGAYPGLTTVSFANSYPFPDEYVSLFYEKMGFVTLTIDSDIIVSVEANDDKLNRWLARIQIDLNKKAINDRIVELKKYLYDTDYVVIKISEGAATQEEYQDVINSRAAARDEISRLEIEKEEV